MRTTKSCNLLIEVTFMENQRIRLSKTMLKNALIELLQQKGIEKITIYELCDEAQINRTTFYKYYGSQYDLLNDIENECLVELEKRFAPNEEQNVATLKNALEYFMSEKVKFKVLFNSAMDKEFLEKLFSLSAFLKLFEVNKPYSYTQKQEKHLRIFAFQGGFAIIREWLNEEEPDAPEEIANLIMAIKSACYR